MDDRRRRRGARGLGTRPLLAPALLAFALLAAPARAQTYEAVGIRAQGMAGAFVATADDASATWWNPAGLAGGAFFNALIEIDDATGDRGGRSGGFSAAFPALGLSYYRSRLSQIQAPTPTGAAGAVRQDQGLVPAPRTLALQQVGATVGQSIGEHFVIGATVKLVRGELNGVSSTRGDVDAGAIAQLGLARLGIAVRNATGPTFDGGADRMSVPRQVRAGVAVSSPLSATVPATLDVDADLTRTPTAFGDVRHVAVGGEAWLFRRRLGLRTGVSLNSTGVPRPSGSGGVSVAVRSGFYLDAQTTQGRDEALTGWSIGARVTF